MFMYFYVKQYCLVLCTYFYYLFLFLLENIIIIFSLRIVYRRTYIIINCYFDNELANILQILHF